MSDLESDSRTSAVGRKRNASAFDGIGRSNKFQRLERNAASHASLSSASSRESGEISSSGKGTTVKIRSGSVSKDSISRQPISIPSDTDESADSRISSSPASSSNESGEIDSDDSGGQDSDNDEAEPQRPDNDDMAAWSPINGHQAQAYDPSTLRGRNLTADSRAAQERHLDPRLKDTPVICTCCGQSDHTHFTCPARTCPHCQAQDAHTRAFCPHNRKCARCRKRGHAARNCRRPSYYGADPCDVCGQVGHVEEECLQLWGKGPSAQNAADQDASAGNRRRVTVKSCHSCGASGVAAHWGDDCPYRDRSNGRTGSERGLVMIWSEKGSRAFAASRSRAHMPSGGVGVARAGRAGGGGAATQSWKMGLLDSAMD